MEGPQEVSNCSEKEFAFGILNAAGNSISVTNSTEVQNLKSCMNSIQKMLFAPSVQTIIKVKLLIWLYPMFFNEPRSLYAGYRNCLQACMLVENESILFNKDFSHVFSFPPSGSGRPTGSFFDLFSFLTVWW